MYVVVVDDGSAGLGEIKGTELMPTEIQTFTDIQERARELYQGRPVQLLMPPIRHPEILEVIEETERAGWVTLARTGDTSQLDLSGTSALEEAVTRLASGEGEVLLSDTLDPRPILQTLLRSDLGLRKESEVWSHVAVYEWQDPPRWLLVSDGVLVTNPDLEQRMEVIHNAVGLAGRLGVKEPKVALLAASRAVQRDVQTSREWSWVSKMAIRRAFRGARVYGPVGLEEAILPAPADAMTPPSINDEISDGPNWADVLITADISVGNPLVSALTLLCEFPCAGIVVGGDVPVVFPWPVINRDSVLTSLALAALCSPRGLRRVVKDEG